MKRSLCILLMTSAMAGFSALTAGCTPAVWSVSSAPPSKVAEFSRDGEVSAIHLSKGVAFAIECADIWDGGACRDATAHIKNLEIAKVLPGHLEKVRSPYSRQSYYWDEDNSHRAVFVLAGVSPGQTKLTIESESGDREFLVDVSP